ncbi:nucleotidyl transferase AbiEii/AbiGii toxin family protein [Candidatus Giovannonibacteria bacterium]|nr:nucleotidyl transferase AbiEii/AbiGii toxin family protein [Candidatus Giovannonibacteria bacterium]
MHSEALTKEGAKVFKKLKAIKGFYLAGGTALALQIGHRISVDFDLFSNKKIKKTLLSQIEKLLAGDKIEISVNNSDELTLFINGVKVTFLHYPFPVLKPFIKHDSFPLLSVEEIAATKAYTIGRRGSYKDYVDIFFVLSGKYTNLEDVLSFANRKYGDAFNGRLFLEQLAYWGDIKDEKIVFLGKETGLQAVKQFFEKTIKTIKL